MRKMPPLAAVRVFEAAARLENFTSAAAELGMTQAAVSYQVKALEERIGAALFVRERGRALPTPLGRRLAGPLGQAFDAIAAAFGSVRADDEALLTITTTHSFANSWLVWRLGGFQLAHPELAVRLDTSNALADLRSGEADVGIRAGDGTWPGMEVVRLMDIEFTPMCAPAFLAGVEGELGRKIAAAELPRLAMLNPDDIWWDSWLTDAGVDPGGRTRGRGLRLDSQANEGHAAMAGQGFVLLTPFLWREDLAEGRLVQPFAQTSSEGFGYWLVTPPERRGVAKIKRFREWLLGAVAEARSG
jgi:LysR family glycine cleavage system transcriptional activator